VQGKRDSIPSHEQNLVEVLAWRAACLDLDTHPQKWAETLFQLCVFQDCDALHPKSGKILASAALKSRRGRRSFA
jgi:hypothetical protein